MKAVIQRVSQAEVRIEDEPKGKIGIGFMVLLGIEQADTDEDIEWLASKIVGLRVMSDAEGKMNLDLANVGGNILLISQFTLYASTKKGNRPSFTEAAKPETAIPLYRKMVNKLSEKLGKPIETGEFGADMKVSLTNDGPVTIIKKTVDQWIRTTGVRYYSELTNMAILTEEVGEVARLMARIYGEQSFKESDKDHDLGDEMADVLFVLICLANQTGIDLTEALRKNLEKKTKRDAQRHQDNQKLK